MIDALPRSLLRPLFAELNGLKRIRPAPSGRSLAERSFVRAWASLAAGRSADAVARHELTCALVATRLAGADVETLTAAGLAEADAGRILDDAARSVAAGLGEWSTGVSALLERVSGAGAEPEPPEFAVLLARQPRAPATRAGTARIDVEPAENHAEHCAAVALIGTIMAVVEGADVGTVWLAALGHHLHNARLPDGGFAGELALGEHLPAIIAGLRREALAQVPSRVAAQVEEAATATVDADTAEGRAFHAADVIDRLLQAHHHARAAGFTVEVAVEEHGLVHDGPLQLFHHSVLDELGL